MIHSKQSGVPKARPDLFLVQIQRTQRTDSASIGVLLPEPKVKPYLVSISQSLRSRYYGVLIHGPIEGHPGVTSVRRECYTEGGEPFQAFVNAYDINRYTPVKSMTFKEMIETAGIQ